MKKVNAFILSGDDVADQPENWLWYEIADGKLLVQTEPDGPIVALSDQALVWLAIEGLCRLRDGDTNACCETCEEACDDCTCEEEKTEVTKTPICACCDSENNFRDVED